MRSETYNPGTYWGDLIRSRRDLTAVGQPNLGLSYNRWAYARRLAALRRALRGVDLAGARVFEAGYGVGFYQHFWGAAGAKRVAGLDISETAWALAREDFPGADLQHGDLTDPETLRRHWPEEHFDVVTAIDVLYHIVADDKWAGALGALARLVDHGGVLVVTDKFPRSAPHQIMPHVRRRPLSAWERVAGETGLALRAIVPVFVLMDDPIATGAHPWLGRVARTNWRLITAVLRRLERSPSVLEAVGGGIAAIQSVPERVFVRMLRRVPNTEIAVFERASS